MAREYVVRFCFVYFTVWCAATQVLGGVLLTPVGGLPALGPMRPITEWVGAHLFGVDARFAPGTMGEAGGLYDHGCSRFSVLRSRFVFTFGSRFKLDVRGSRFGVRSPNREPNENLSTNRERENAEG